MKKLLWLLLVSFIVMPAYANVNTPATPSYKTTTTNISPSQSYKKEISNPYSDIIKAAQKNNTTSVKQTKESAKTNKTATAKKANNSGAKNNTNNTKANTSYSEAEKQRLDSLAMKALKAAENRNNSEMNNIIQKMAETGAEGFSTPQVIAKKTPHCPPIKIEINGKQLSGSKCAMMAYLYKGKQYKVGYCR